MIAIGLSHANPRHLPTRSESISHTKICPWKLMAASLIALNYKQPDFHCGTIMQLYCYYLVTKLCLTLLRFPWAVVHQAPLSIGFSKQEYWSGLPFLPPGDLPNPGIKPTSAALDSLPLSHHRSPYNWILLSNNKKTNYRSQATAQVNLKVILLNEEVRSKTKQQYTLYDFVHIKFFSPPLLFSRMGILSFQIRELNPWSLQ